MTKTFIGALSKVFALAALAASLAGCASTAPSRFYALTPVPASEARDIEGGQPLTVGVTRVKLPDYLGRQQIATRIGPNEIRFDEFSRWAEPLKENFSRVLIDDLAVFLGTEKVLLAAWAGAVPVDYQIWLEVTRFDAAPAGDVTLTAKWALFRQNGKKFLVTKSFTRLEAAGATGYEAMASAGSRAVAALSREIAEAIRATR